MPRAPPCSTRVSLCDAPARCSKMHILAFTQWNWPEIDCLFKSCTFKINCTCEINCLRFIFKKFNFWNNTIYKKIYNLKRFYFFFSLSALSLFSSFFYKLIIFTHSLLLSLSLLFLFYFSLLILFLFFFSLSSFSSDFLCSY